MKKLFFMMFVVVLAAGVAAAQTYTQGTGLGGVDILGAHNNGGRGCAGCHAPHSGSAGGGGNVATNAAAFNDPLSGSVALFGQDVTPLLGYQITLGNGYVETLPSEANAYKTQTAELEGITMCLACHDGVVAKGQMMNGQAWEQRMNLLPASVYGTRPIPTLLGNDSGNGNSSGYGNDHPVGVQATLGAARVWTNNTTTSPLTITVDAVNGITNIAPNSAAYVSFNTNYGYPAIAGSAWGWGVSIPSGDTNPGDAFLTCTTATTSMRCTSIPPREASRPALPSTGTIRRTSSSMGRTTRAQAITARPWRLRPRSSAVSATSASPTSPLESPLSKRSSN